MSEEGKYKLLVVDDNPQAVDMLQIILEDEGYEVVTALDGETALLKIGDEKPDLVILDITLPGIDGYQVCDTIKNNPNTSDIPIIMLTGRDQGDDFDKAMNLKADWYVVKPYNVEHLLKVFNKLLKKQDGKEE